MTVREENAASKFRAPTNVIADYLSRSISISYLLQLALSGRLILVSTTVLGLLYGIYSVYSNGPSYMATMRISPAPSDTNLGELTSGGGLLASLTGGNAAAQVPKFIQFTYGLSSAEVARALDQKYDLLCVVYRGDCDIKTHQWTPRRGIREWTSSVLARLSGLPDPNAGPRSINDLASYIDGMVAVEQIKKTDAVYSLSYINRNPHFAAQFLDRVVKATNDYVRAQSRESQKRYVEYLTRSAANTTNVEQRQAIDTLLLQEERQLMMTEVDIPYAAQILDGPIVMPVNHAMRIIATYALLGLVLGLALAMSRDLLPHKWRVW